MGHLPSFNGYCLTSWQNPPPPLHGGTSKSWLSHQSKIWLLTLWHHDTGQIECFIRRPCFTFNLLITTDNSEEIRTVELFWLPHVAILCDMIVWHAAHIVRYHLHVLCGWCTRNSFSGIWPLVICVWSILMKVLILTTLTSSQPLLLAILMPAKAKVLLDCWLFTLRVGKVLLATHSKVR